ncbi:hypothetical protein [Desulfovibrio litoralis]|uniref:Uncharacterized protein n=1 Tax=Desulfovibrio litoralis DSM 11393 TaxID=1121455 RepID=A0A1M7T7M6_9BACT|nr:hypothetical protein [Desulfovibrio litoralis]SHN66725.1 hypothetical protein SAMN02745728_01682 [Desulfovibrio litoralis DSM 11393]
MKINKICPVCGLEFLAMRDFAIYCSGRCRNKDRNKKEPTLKTCSFCKSEFLSSQPHAKYCSPLCSQKATYEEKEKRRRLKNLAKPRVSESKIKRYSYDLSFNLDQEFCPTDQETFRQPDPALGF